MTIRQRLLKFIYPLFRRVSSKTNKAMFITNQHKAMPLVSFYTLDVELNNGVKFPFEKLRGKKILIVNTASDCGYTPQYDELQQLYETTKDQLEIIAFPSNDFKEQEKGSDEEIAQFCSINFNIQFPLAKKSVVIKSKDQNKVFKWLTTKEQNGWNEQGPSWNFSKFLVDENGILIGYFEPAVSPTSNTVRALL